MSLGHAILGFLSRQPMTGYDLKTRCFDDDAAHFWSADQAQIYRTLERLEAKRLVSADWSVQFGKPDRKVFAITEAGRDELKHWLAMPRPLPPVRDPFLVQLFFSAELPEDDIVALLESSRAEHEAALDVLNSRAATREGAMHRTARQKRDSALLGVTLEAAMRRERAALEWIDDCISTVKHGLPGHSVAGANRFTNG